MKANIFYLLLLLISVSNSFAANEENTSDKRNTKLDNELVNSYYYVKDLLFAQEMIEKEYFLISMLKSVENELLIRKTKNEKVEFPSESDLKKLNKDLSLIKYNIDGNTMKSITDKIHKDVLEEQGLALLRTRLIKTTLIESATPEEKLSMFNKDLKVALKAYSSGDFDFTYFIINEVLSSYNYKNLDDVLFYKGECLIQKNSLTEAARTFQRIVEEYPESSYYKKSFERLITLYYLKGEYDKVVAGQKIAAKNLPLDSLVNADLNFIVGLSYYKLMQYKEANIFLTNIKESDDYYKQALYLRANSLSLLQKHDEARDLYLKIKTANVVAKIDDINNVIYEGAQLKLGYLSFNIAEIRKKINNIPGKEIKNDEILTKSINEAFEYFSKISQKSRYYQDALMGKAWVEHNLGNYNKSNEYINELTTKFPETDFIYESKTLQGFNKEMLGQTADKNEDYEFVLNAQVELANNELFVAERLLISSLVTKLADTKRLLLEQTAPISKFYQYQDARDSLMILLGQTSRYMEKLSADNHQMAKLTDNSYRKKLLTAIINSTKKEINRLNDISSGLFDMQDKFTKKSNYKELVQLNIEKNNIQNLLKQADMISIFSGKRLDDINSREIDIQRWSDLSFLKYVLSNVGIEELDKIERDINQMNLQINTIDNTLGL